jgi:dipeptide/tripeptide permease
MTTDTQSDDEIDNTITDTPTDSPVTDFANSDSKTHDSPATNKLVFLRYPRVVWLILLNEICERYAFYGFKVLLPLYFRDYLEFSEDGSTALVHGFVFLAFFTPLLGGFLSDSVFGKFWTIVSLSIVYSIGQIVVSLTSIPGATGTTPPHWWGAALGLILVAIGTGGIKPCVSAMGADQFSVSQSDIKASFFSIFYFSINMGATASMILTPVIRVYVGYAVAFAIPATLLCISVVVFAIGKKWYVHVPPTGIKNNTFLHIIRVILSAIKNRTSENRVVSHWLDRARGEYSIDEVYDVKCVLRACFILLPLVMFFALYDQQSTRWVFQASRMNCNLGLFSITPEQTQFLNPLGVIILVLVFDRVVYKIVERCGVQTTPLRRFGVGIMFGVFSFVVSALVEVMVVLYPGKVHITAQLPQILLICVAEILVCVTGLEFAYSEAPSSFKSAMTAYYLFMISIGNMIVFAVASVSPIPEDVKFRQVYEFIVYAFVLFLVLIVFMFFARRYNYRAARDESIPDGLESEASLEMTEDLNT